MRGGYHVPNTTVNVKTAHIGQDVMQREKSPDAVFAQARDDGVNLALLTAYSYYIAEGVDPENTTVAKELSAWQASGKARTTVLVPAGRLAARRIVHANRTWEFRLNLGNITMDPGSWWVGEELLGTEPQVQLTSTPPIAAFKTSEAQQGSSQCDCLQWDTLYSSMRVLCGQGPEFFFALNKTSMPVMDPRLDSVRAGPGNDFCTKFFERMKSNLGVRIRFNMDSTQAGRQWYDASWCYVDGACPTAELGGGERIPGTDVSWKFTRRGRDATLGELAPDSLIKVAAKDDFDLGTAMGYAYYVSVGEEKEAFDQAWELSTAATGLTTVLQPGWSLYPRKIVQGDAAWLVEYNPENDNDTPGTWWRGRNVSGVPVDTVSDVGLARRRFPNSEAAGLSTSNSEEEQPASCKCLNWTHVYNSELAACGQGLEFYFAMPDNATALPRGDERLEALRSSVVGAEICTGFFEKFNNNLGVRVKFETRPSEAGQFWYDASWCYVSSACPAEHLRGGAPIPGTQVSWKITQKGQDSSLSDLDAATVFKVGKGLGFNPGTVAGFAYYVEPVGVTTPAASYANMLDAGHSGETLVVRQRWQKAPFVVKKGRDTWELPV